MNLRYLYDRQRKHVVILCSELFSTSLYGTIGSLALEIIVIVLVKELGKSVLFWIIRCRYEEL